MSIPLQIQTPNALKLLTVKKVIPINAPIPNQLGEEVKLLDFSIELTNSFQVLLFTGLVPIELTHVNFKRGGNVSLLINIYNYEDSPRPIFTACGTLVATCASVIFNNINFAGNFQFIYKLSDYVSNPVKKFTITAQLLSTIPIVNQMYINFLPNDAISNYYFNVLVQQIS